MFMAGQERCNMMRAWREKKKRGGDFLFITFSAAGTAEKYIFPRPRAAVTVLFQLAV